MSKIMRITRHRALYIALTSFAFVSLLLGGDSPLNAYNRRDLAEEQRGEESETREPQLNILTLGGSVTWGASLDNRSHAYPYLLKNDHGHNITNLAIRGTGSFYPAQCISSMMKKFYHRYHAGPDAPEYNPDNDEIYDVIIFEYSVNGMHGFRLLFDRMKERYPDALFLYIDLFSFSRGNFDSTEAMHIVREGGGYVYQFPNKGNPIESFDFRSIMNTNKPVEDYPIWQTRQMFADDEHHLSPQGHSMLTGKITEIINTYIRINPNPRLGSLLGGDKCTSWYDNGEIPSSPAIIDGGNMREWDVEKEKWAIEVEEDGLILEYDHDSDEAASLNIQFMTKCENAWSPLTTKYPPVIAAVKQSEIDISEAKELAMNSKVNLDVKMLHKVESISEGWQYISPLHNKHMEFHITEIKHLGILEKGKNFILIYPVKEGGHNATNPFRITATIMCEACKRLGWDGDVW